MDSTPDTASTVLLVIFKEDIMWNKETIKNKIYALVFIGIGALSILSLIHIYSGLCGD